MDKKSVKIFKVIMLVLVIGILFYLTIKLLPMFKNIATSEGRTEFKSTIENLGFKGIFVILGLMFAQMFLAFLPGEPVEILAGLCYGAIGRYDGNIFGSFYK